MNKILFVNEDFTEQSILVANFKKMGFDVVTISSEFLLAQQILSFNPDFVVVSGQSSKVSSVGVGKKLKEMPRWLGKTILGFPAGQRPDPQDLIKIRMDYVLETPVVFEKLFQLIAKVGQLDEKMLLEKLNKQAVTEKNNDSRSSGMVTGQKFGLSDEKIHVTGQVDSSDDLFKAPSLDQVQNELTHLSEGGVPDKSKTVSFEGGKPDQSEADNLAKMAGQRWANTIDLANAQFKDRLQKARKDFQNINLKKESTVQRSETRKIQNDLNKSWKLEDLKDQDKLRQEFTKALFKKENE